MSRSIGVRSIWVSSHSAKRGLMPRVIAITIDLTASGTVTVDQRFCARVFGLAEKRIGFRIFNDLSIGHDKNTVRHLARKTHLMRDNEHGHAILGDLLH